MRRTAVVLILLFAALGAIRSRPPRVSFADRPTPTPVNSRLTSCTAPLTPTVGADVLRLCDRTSVTVKVFPECPVCPGGVKVIFLVPMNSRNVDWVRDSAEAALERMERFSDQSPEVSVIRFSDNLERVAQRFTPDLRQARGELRVFYDQPVTIPPYDQVANLAAQTLRDKRKENPQPNSLSRCEVVIFYVEAISENNRFRYPPYIDLVTRAAQILRGEEVTLMIGCVEDPRGQSCVRERDFASPQRYFAIPPQIYPMAENVEMAFEGFEKDHIFLRELDLEQVLPRGVTYLPGSADPPSATLQPPAPDGSRLLTWKLDEDRVRDTGALTFTYAITAVSPGTWPISGTVHLRDKFFFTRDTVLPSIPVTVTNDLCLPTPTPTATSTDTPSPSPTATPIPSATPTATAIPPTLTPLPPTATPTPEPRAIFLPLALRESCADNRSFADVVLVLDVSTSMQRLTRSGRTKLEATQDAAKAFVALMDLTLDGQGRHNQAAVVGFNREAWIEAPLGADRATIDAAIDRLVQHSAQFTRLDLAFQRGLEALDPALKRPGNKPVLILVTDGLPDQVPPAEDGRMETTVLRAADQAKAAGVTIFTIGIGAPEDTNPDLLKACATDPDHYAYTPDPEDLGILYRAIASDFGCPADRFWGRRGAGPLSPGRPGARPIRVRGLP